MIRDEIYNGYEMRRNLVFWLEFPLIHMSPLIKCLSFMKGYNVVVVSEFDIPQWRLNMGFDYPCFGDSEVFLSPDKRTRDRLVSKYSGYDSVHVFQGLRHVKNNYYCYRELKKKSCYMVLYFEKLWLDRSIKALVRFLYYRFFFETNKKNIDLMLALGRLGYEQFVWMGLPRDSVYEFGYYYDNDLFELQEKSEEPCVGNPVKLIFVGRLKERKNVAILIKAVYGLRNSGFDVVLDIVGDGLEYQSLKQLVKDLQVERYIRFLGVLPNNALKNIYNNCDAVVLPSKFEGWGAVSVEAMACGASLIISDACASECIIKDPLHGRVFKSDSLGSLVNELSVFSNEIEFYRNGMHDRAVYMKENFSGLAGAQKLLRILGDVLPS